jgi:hypothetical protein
MDDDGRRQLEWLARELDRLALYLDQAQERPLRDPMVVIKVTAAEVKAFKAVAEQAAQRGKVIPLRKEEPGRYGGS